MKTLQEILEGAQTTIYHGGNRLIKKLDPKSMIHEGSNNQEGVGIYFGDTIDIAKSYGDKLVYIEVVPRKFVDARQPAKRFMKANEIAKLISLALKKDSSLQEDIFYFVSDYVEIMEPEDLEDYHIEEAAHQIIDNEIRYMQVELAELLGGELFVKLWNKVFRNIHGTYNSNEGFWSVINTDYKVYPVE